MSQEVAGHLAFALEWGSFGRFGRGQVGQEQRTRVGVPIAESALDGLGSEVQVRNGRLLLLLNGPHRLSEASQGRLCPLVLDALGDACLRPAASSGRALDEVARGLHLLYRCESPDVKTQPLSVEFLQPPAEGAIDDLDSAFLCGEVRVQPAAADVQTLGPFGRYESLRARKVFVQVVLLGDDVVVCAELLPVEARVFAEDGIVKVGRVTCIHDA